jgi:hypothetical protein
MQYMFSMMFTRLSENYIFCNKINKNIICAIFSSLAFFSVCKVKGSSILFEKHDFLVEFLSPIVSVLLEFGMG